MVSVKWTTSEPANPHNGSAAGAAFSSLRGIYRIARQIDSLIGACSTVSKKSFMRESA